jgi:nitrogen-specific signal transduction histidine kinase
MTETLLSRVNVQTEIATHLGVRLLAAGIAHNFNNLLTGVIGNASLVLESQ